MGEPSVLVRLEHGGTSYYPGETLSGEYRIQGITPEHVKAVEVSVLWHTEGKGDEDLAVHHFERLSAENGDAHPPTSGEFRTVLPNSPLSYQGVTIKLGWCVRVRVFPRRGKPVVGEAPFRLGDVPAVRAAES
jgi:hypothetical protein